MRQTRRSLLLTALLSLGLVRGDEVVYVTDMTIYTALASCAAYAVSEYVQAQTENKCPVGVTALQSCVCSQDNNFAAISSSIASAVSGNCGATATDDIASASTVLSAYCNQASNIQFAAPATPVTQYITDIPEIQYLAPCASSALTYNIMHMTYSLCPPDATALATCACLKNQNSLRISAAINSDVKADCSSHTADISSAQAMFAAYCSLNNGTSSFPTPTNPPGDMTYYITAMPQYSSLATCVADAVSYAVNQQTEALCPSGPAALASCACIKSPMASLIENAISSNVKDDCESTATEEISMALDVFATYCSAALGSITVGSISESIAQSTPTADGSGSGGISGSSGTGAGAGGGGGVSKSSPGGAQGGKSTNGSSPAGGGGTSTPLIAGAVVGVVGGLALVGVGLFYLIRYIRQNKTNAAAAEAEAAAGAGAGAQPPTAPNNFENKPELLGTPIAAGALGTTPPIPPVSPSPSMLKANVPPRIDNVSPASMHNSAYMPPPSATVSSGLTPPPFPASAELQGGAGAPYQTGPAHTSAELQGQGAVYPGRAELASQGGSPYQTGPAHTNAELPGQGGYYPSRPELAGQYVYPQGQGQMPAHGQAQSYYPPQGQQSPQMPVQGQAQPYYPPQGQQPQQMPGHGQAQPYYPPQGQPIPPQQGQPGMGWHAGPLQGYHEMDGSYPGQGGPGQAR